MAGPPGRRSRLQLPNYRLSIPPPLLHPLGGGPDPQSFSQPLTHLGSLKASTPRAVAPVRGERLENVDYSPLLPHLSKSPLISLFPTFLFSHRFPSNLGHFRPYNGREPNLCTGPTPHIELDLRAGDVWEAVPGDLGNGVLRPPLPSSQGAALGNRGRKKMPPPAHRRLLRPGAGASPGLHRLALGSSARWSAKATPGKGTPPPLLWSRLPGHLHPVNHSRKRPRVRDPGAHWDPTVPAPLSTVPAIPQLFCHPDSAQIPSWGRERYE